MSFLVMDVDQKLIPLDKRGSGRIKVQHVAVGIGCGIKVVFGIAEYASLRNTGR